MAPYSEASKLWRERNKDLIALWKRKFQDLLERRRIESWDTEKFEMEIGNALEDQKIKDIWFFVTFYVVRYPRSNLSKFFSEVVDEIKDFGTMEPLRLKRVLKSVETTRRKMDGR